MKLNALDLSENISATWWTLNNPTDNHQRNDCLFYINPQASKKTMSDKSLRDVIYLGNLYVGSLFHAKLIVRFRSRIIESNP